MKQETVLENFYRGKRVLITGHTGFKGSWLWTWLRHWGAELWGYALAPEGEDALFSQLPSSWGQSKVADIRQFVSLRDYIQELQPDIIFHLAAQPLVLRAYQEPLYTIETNVLGSSNLLQAFSGLQKAALCIYITTDKVYENREWIYPYRENDALGGHDIYSSSKACTELLAASWRQSFLQGSNKALATARAGNVIGGGDWAEYRILPDAARAWSKKEPLVLRRPSAIRPWQHVLDALYGYLLLAYKLQENPEAHSQAYNFGPSSDEAISVGQLSDWAAALWPGAAVEKQREAEGPHEAQRLRLDCSKAMQELNWTPRWQSKEAVEKTMRWYHAYCEQKESAETLCLRDIEDFLGTGF